MDRYSQKNFYSSTKKLIVLGDSQGFDIYKSLSSDEQLGLTIFQISYECTAFNLVELGARDAEKECQDAYERFFLSDELKKAHVLVYSFY